MSDLKLTLACWDYDRTRPLIDGRVKAEGIDLNVEVLRPRQTFQRMLDNKEFEVSELSLASYTALKGRGGCPFVAVPVALSKIFRHSCIYVRTGAGIHTPQNLKGKRVGTSQRSSTGLVFMRGMLQHDYGVKPQDMHWFMGGLSSSCGGKRRGSGSLLRPTGERTPLWAGDRRAAERLARRFLFLRHGEPH